jgi:phosphopentomutase
MMQLMNDEDLLIITADHGCDPTFKGTDHTREYVPFLVYGRNVAATDLGTGDSFADSGETVRDILNVSGKLPIGVSRKSQIQKMKGAI